MNISPASATIKHCEKKKCGIQEINDICYRVASAFSGSDVWNVPPKYSTECDNIVEMARKDIYGVGYCDHKTPYKPLILNPPSEFVRLYNKSNNVEKALVECKKLCAKGRNPNECVQDCDIMSGAITEKKRENYTEGPVNIKNQIKFLKAVQFITYVLIFVLYSYMMYGVHKSSDTPKNKSQYYMIYTVVLIGLCVMNYFAITLHFLGRSVVVAT
jgi:hypothetical protein